MNLLTFFANTMPGMPQAAAWLAPLILVLLGVSAAIDAYKGKIPDPIILTGLLITVVVEGVYAGWPFAGKHVLGAFAAGIFIYGVNEIWYHFKKSDAIGMGDAKWTALAVACFMPKPVAIAWGLGACLALLWMGTVRAFGRKMIRVYFAPFLWLGLVAGFCWLHIR